MWHTLFFSLIGLTGTSTVRGLALTAQQVRAMLLKRVHHSRRDWKGLFSQVVLPVLFVIAAMGLGSIKSDLQHFPEIVLSPALYHVDEQYSFFRLDSLFSVTCLWFKKCGKYGYLADTFIQSDFHWIHSIHFITPYILWKSNPWPCLFHILMICSIMLLPLNALSSGHYWK